jgi:hypothetical protein
VAVIELDDEEEVVTLPEILDEGLGVLVKEGGTGEKSTRKPLFTIKLSDLKMNVRFVPTNPGIEVKLPVYTTELPFGSIPFTVSLSYVRSESKKEKLKRSLPAKYQVISALFS